MKNLILQQIRELKQKQLKSQPKAKSATSSPPKQESQLQKTSTFQTTTTTTFNTCTFKSQSQQILPSLQLFKGMAFCFPLIDIDLSPKRVEFMGRAIREEGGRVVAFKDQQVSQRIDYLLVNPRVPVGTVLRKVERKVLFRQILDYHYVLHSLRETILLAVSSYSLYRSPTQDHAGHPFPPDQRDRTCSHLPSKLVKTEETQSQNYRRVEASKEEELTEDEDEDKYQAKSASDRQQPNVSSNLQNLTSGQKRPLNKDAFLCQKGLASSSSFSVNKFICDELMKLQKIYQNEKDIGRKIAYLKAVSAIRSLDKEIESECDLENLRGVGCKIIKKVKELLSTGRLQKLERMQQSEKRVVIELFSKIWGVGPNKAEELYSKGIRSIEQLRGKSELLSKNQKIGLRYYEELSTKIPRDKVSRIFVQVRRCFCKLVDSVDNYRLQVCGSYRRGRPLCGDIDILICRKDHIYEKKLLLELVLQLERAGLLTDHLLFPSPSEQSSMSYMGVCVFEDQVHHRIDIKYYPTAQYPYALLYFTGSDMFNRSMRLYASKRGLQLSDHGAVARRKHQNDQVWEGTVPQCLTQEEIFGFLGLDFKTPMERDL